MEKYSPEFGNRLKHFGIQRDLLKEKKITIDRETHWDDHGAPFEVKVHTTKSLDELKRLIGNPDEHFEKGIAEPIEAHAALARLSDVADHQVAAAASAYVFGNSKPLAHLAPSIEKAMGEVRVQVAAAEEMVVDKKWVITGSDPKHIETDKLVFTKDGQIYCEGILTINAGTIANLEK